MSDPGSGRRGVSVEGITDPTTDEPARRPARWWADAPAALFPAPVQAMPARWWLAVLAVFAAVAVTLGRVGGHGPFDTLWIEDAWPFLHQAINESWTHTIFRPHNGYWHIGPRTLTEVADLFPLAYMPAAMTVLAAIMLTVFAFVAYQGSRAFFPSPWMRLLIAAPVLLIPVGQTQMQVDLATLHFPGLYAMFWICFWRPATRTGRTAAPAVTLYLVFSSILNVVFAPLLLLRLIAVRDRTTRLVGAAYTAGMTLQLGGVVTGYNQRGVGEPDYNPAWLAGEYVRVAVPRALFGEQWAGFNTARPHWAWVAAGIAVLAAALFVAVRGYTRPAWPLAAAAFLLSVANFAAQVGSMGWIEPRYVAVPGLLLYVTVLALLRPRLELAGVAAVAVFAVLLAVVFTANYRTPESFRSAGPSWRSVLHDADTACTADPQRTSYVWTYVWWSVELQCERFR